MKEVQNEAIALSSIFGNFENVTYDQFVSVTQRSLGEQKYFAISWLPRVKHSEREYYEELANEVYNTTNLTFTDTTNQHISFKPYYYPVLYISPIVGNEGAILFDLSSRNSTNQSIINANRTRSAVLSPPITLVQNGKTGIILIHPVYNLNQQLIGVITLVEVIENFIEEGIKNLRYDSLDIVMVDQDGELLISGHILRQKIWPPIGQTRPTSSYTFNDIRDINVIDRVWTIHLLQDRNISNLLVIIVTNIVIISILTSIICLIVFIVHKRTQFTITQLLYKEKQIFVGYIFHELRVPFHSLKLGLMNVLESRKVSSKTKRSIRVIYNISLKINQLLDDVLDISKIESGKFNIVKKYFNITEGVKNIIETFQHNATAKNIDLTVQIDEALYRKEIYADELRLEQCISNYVSNAIKYTNEGCVKVCLRLDWGHLVCKVEDTGYGIPSKDMNKLFVPYQQIEHTNYKSSSGAGTGLGLSIVKHIVEKHGGQVNATSVEGEGSVFGFTIPTNIREPLDEDDIEMVVRTTKSTYTNKKVLVVDDDELNRTFFSTYLSRKQINIETAVDGEDALEKIKKNKYDLVFTDYKMPRMDGKQLVDEVRKFNSELLVIGISGNAELCSSNWGGCELTNILTKPIDFKKLDKMLEEYLG